MSYRICFRSSEDAIGEPGKQGYELQKIQEDEFGDVIDSEEISFHRSLTAAKKAFQKLTGKEATEADFWG